MDRLRWKLARWLIGRFVTLPDRDGVWIVTHNGPATVTIEAEEFALELSRSLNVRQYGDVPDFAAWRTPKSVGTFHGTVKA